jgi:hypothetical protein
VHELPRDMKGLADLTVIKTCTVAHLPGVRAGVPPRANIACVQYRLEVI